MKSYALNDSLTIYNVPEILHDYFILEEFMREIAPEISAGNFEHLIDDNSPPRDVISAEEHERALMDAIDLDDASPDHTVRKFSMYAETRSHKVTAYLVNKSACLVKSSDLINVFFASVNDDDTPKGSLLSYLESINIPEAADSGLHVFAAFVDDDVKDVVTSTQARIPFFLLYSMVRLMHRENARESLHEAIHEHYNFLHNYKKIMTDVLADNNLKMELTG